MRRLIFILLLFSAFGCSKFGLTNLLEDSHMQVNSMVKSSAGFGSDTPVFLFWLDTDFTKISQNASVQPYLVAWPYLGIDEYNPGKRTYDTGKKYPENNQTVYCTGYYPSTLVTGQEAGKNTWATLEIPEDGIGTTDVMVVRGPITGKGDQHFEKKNPAEPLVFIHAQSKVNFTAKMGSDMAKNRYLRNVRVIIPGKDLLLTSFRWQEQNSRYAGYEILQDENFKVTLKDPNPAQLDPNEISRRELGSLYIRPGMDKISFDLEVEMSETVTFDSYEVIRTSEPMTLNFTSNGTGISLEEGDEYDINITVLYDSFVVTGNKAKWQEGGNIPLPF